MKKIFGILVLGLVVISLFGCGAKDARAEEVKKIIKEAETMTLDELMAKAYEEIKEGEFYGVGNSSRGRAAGETFVEAMQAKYPDYKVKIEWSQPKDNNIFTQLTEDSSSANPQMSMTLIQDGAQIQSKMIDTGILLNFIPKEWKEASGTSVEKNGQPLALQTLSKVFMFNHLGVESGDYTNVWHFVAEGEKPLFMGLNSEPIGFNALLMLTHETYIPLIKGAFEALSATEKAYFQPTIDEVQPKVAEYNLAADAEYSLAWIKLWVNKMQVETDDGPISQELVKNSAAGKTGLLVFSKLRSIEESAEVSAKNVTVAAYQPDYVGFGGYAYKHYLQVLKSSPLPWTAAAFIAYMVTDVTGFHPWGKDPGGYSSNPNLTQDHSQNGYVDGVNEFPSKNDKGEAWWLSLEAGKGRLVVEDPVYAAKVSFTVGSWIETLVGFQ